MTYGDHLAVYTYIESLCCTTERNIMLYVKCISIFKKGISSSAFLRLHGRICFLTFSSF